MNYRDIIRDHHYAGRSFDGTANTVAEIAEYLIHKAVTDLRTMQAWKDKDEDAIIKTDRISHFMHNLGNAPRLGVDIPINGPAMKLRTESFGSYSMNGVFWLSGFRKGIYDSREDMGCGEATLDQLHERVRAELERIPEGDEPSMPSYERLSMRSGPAKKPHGWYGITVTGPRGETFDMGEMIWPHANESAIAVAVEKIMLTTSCLHIHEAKFQRQKEDLHDQVEAILGDIPLTSISIKDFQGGHGAPLWDSRVVTYQVEFAAKDEFLRSHQLKTDLIFKSDGIGDAFESLRKIVAVQKRRHHREHIVASRPSLLMARHRADIDIFLEHFVDRREYNSPEHSYTLNDGMIDMNASLDPEGRVRYEEGILRLKGYDLPETSLQAMRSKDAREIVDHPILDGCVVRKARRLKDHVALYLNAPLMSEEECRSCEGREKAIV